MPSSQDPFDFLLDWLDPDRDLAAQKYETIRAGLIRIFVAKGFSDAEDLADEAFSRVTKKLPEIRDTYVGDPAYYFRGVARNLIHEVYRRPEIATEVSPETWNPVPIRSSLYDCLLRCLQFLAPAKRELILDYHVYAGHDKIEFHRIMAAELGISEGALRGRAFHLRAELEKCVLACNENLDQKTKGAARTIVNGGAGTRSVNHGRGNPTSN